MIHSRFAQRPYDEVDIVASLLSSLPSLYVSDNADSEEVGIVDDTETEAVPSAAAGAASDAAEPLEGAAELAGAGAAGRAVAAASWLPAPPLAGGRRVSSSGGLPGRFVTKETGVKPAPGFCACKASSSRVSRGAEPAAGCEAKGEKDAEPSMSMGAADENGLLTCLKSSSSSTISRPLMPHTSCKDISNEI